LQRLIVGAVMVSSVIGCGSKNAEQPPRSVAEVKRAFAHHGIALVRFEPSIGPRVPYAGLFGESGSLSVSVQVYQQGRGGKALRQSAGRPHMLRARNVLVTWQGADSPSVEAAVDELR
jgi:hypothetical protein